MDSPLPTLFALAASTIFLVAGAGCARFFPSAPVSIPSPGRPLSAAPTQLARSTIPEAVPALWTFVVVRHAERADDGTDDPPLTATGADRSRRLADRLSSAPGVAVYATAYRRTQATANPTATAWNVPMTTYDGGAEATSLIDGITRQHPSGIILIVGHADTVPAIVGNLCRCEVEPIEETDFGNLYEVALAADGSVVRAGQTSEF